MSLCTCKVTAAYAHRFLNDLDLHVAADIQKLILGNLQVSYLIRKRRWSPLTVS